MQHYDYFLWYLLTYLNVTDGIVLPLYIAFAWGHQCEKYCCDGLHGLIMFYLLYAPVGMGFETMHKIGSKESCDHLALYLYTWVMGVWHRANLMTHWAKRVVRSEK